MPYGDGTGPWWAQGRFGCRKGFGRGFRGAFQRESIDELSGLKAYADDLAAELKEVKKRIAALEKG